ncbi:PHP domain-containing protein [Leucobacter sp. GX0328]
MESMPAAGYDLHTHSTFSDGTTSPAEIAREAARIGLTGFALTDHDTIDGWGEAREAAAAAGVDFVPGIEITTKHRGRSRHLLGYGIRPEAGELFETLAEIRESRLARAREMVRRLSGEYAISWDAVVGSNDVRTVGRPHIADALVAAGYAVDRSAAFAEMLSPASPYYLDTYAVDTANAIRLVRDAGGFPVIAHPAASRQRRPLPVDDLAELAEAGLGGVELDHPENRADWLPPLAAHAVSLGLEVTGASDYHGDGKPNRLGECTSPPEVVARIRADVALPA